MNENEKMEVNASDVSTMPDVGMEEMEDFFQRHFIRIDERNRVAHAFSDVPEFDNPPPQEGETDILINERGGRHVRLIVDGELTEENPVGMLRNEQGVLLLKWDAKAKKVVRRTEKEIQADIEAMKPPLEAHQKDGIIQTHMILVEALQVPIEHKGRFYSTTLEKQTLLLKQISLYTINKQAGMPMELSWNATGELCEPWEFPALLELANAMMVYVEPLVHMQREAEVKIIHSKNEQEVQNHVERFRNDLWAVVGK